MADLSLKTTIDASQLVADFGDYYLNSGQNLDNLHMLPMESFDTRDAFTIITTNDTILRESNVEFGSILQQYQDDFTPKGDVTFKPREIPLFQMKVDQRFNPTSLQKTWVAFLTTNALDRATWPFVRWISEVYLIGQSNEDMELYAIHNGEYEAPVEGEPGDASKVMNGVNKIIVDAEAAGDLDFITTGAPDATPATFVGQVEAFVKSMPEKYRRMNMQINMSRTLEERFVEGMQVKYNVNYAQTAQLRAVRNFENISVIGRPSLMGKSRIWATPKYNAIMGVKGFENREVFKIESEKRFVNMFTDYWAGIGFINYALVFANEQE